MTNDLVQPICILVIAYGNPLRRDDGAGLALADRLAQRWQAAGISVQQINTHQLVPELAAEIAESHATAVIFVDATPAAVPTATALGIQVRKLEDTPANPVLGHHVDPALIRYMAQNLYGVQIPTWLVTISGSDFEHGQGFSDEVVDLLDRSDRVARDIVERMKSVPNKPQLHDPPHLTRSKLP